MMTAVPGAALRRAIRRGRVGRAEPDQDEERCDLCAAPLPSGSADSHGHRHLLDEQRDGLLCSCQACALLFEREAAGRGHYRLVPEHRRRLAELDTHALGLPVGLVFFVRDDDGRVVANYPSALGATHAEVDEQTWRGLVEQCPPLGELAPGVQALLVNTNRGACEHWVVPIDVCYRLVAVIKREWQGLSGGGTVWPAIEEFFAELAG
jgi:hypothetical protein